MTLFCFVHATFLVGDFMLFKTSHFDVYQLPSMGIQNRPLTTMNLKCYVPHLSLYPYYSSSN